jgi:hypothetical protein
MEAQYGTVKAVGILDDVQLTGDPLSPTRVTHAQPAPATTDG